AQFQAKPLKFCQIQFAQGLARSLIGRECGYRSAPIMCRRPPTGFHSATPLHRAALLVRGSGCPAWLGGAAPQRSDDEPGSSSMDYAKPTDVVRTMIDSAGNKLALAPRDLLIRGMLSGALLGAATSLAFTGAISTGQPLVGALIFPVGLVMFLLLGLELVTGSFALLPLARLEHGVDTRRIVANWGWVFLGNLIGSVIYGALLAIALTNMGTLAPAGVAARIVAIAEAKTTGYAALG